MTDQYSKDLEMASKQRQMAEAQAARDLHTPDKTYTTTIDKAEAEALNRDPISGAPGAHPIGTGIGSAGGAAAGAIFGSVAGPVGTFVGSVVGAVVGGLVGKGAGEEANPTAEELYWRESYTQEPYYNSSYAYEDYAPAYRLGYESRAVSGSRIWEEQQDAALRSEWEQRRGTSRLSWDDARRAARAASERYDHTRT